MLWLAAAAALYLAVLVVLWWAQERLLFVPEHLPQAYRFDAGADVQERTIDVPGATLHALHLRLPAPRGVVFFLHGNAGSLRSWFSELDYRGYGKSTGRIESEAQLHADVRAAWDRIAPLYAGKTRVLLGRSLGTALAARLALDAQPEMTVLVSPYSSMRALAADHYPWVPGALLRYPLATDAALAQLRRPVLLVHGELDTLIAPSHSEALRRANPAAHLHIVKGAGHNDLDAFDDYRAVLLDALNSL